MGIFLCKNRQNKFLFPWGLWCKKQSLWITERCLQIRGLHLKFYVCVFCTLNSSSVIIIILTNVSQSSLSERTHLCYPLFYKYSTNTSCFSILECDHLCRWPFSPHFSAAGHQSHTFCIKINTEAFFTFPYFVGNASTDLLSRLDIFNLTLVRLLLMLYVLKFGVLSIAFPIFLLWYFLFFVFCGISKPYQIFPVSM